MKIDKTEVFGWDAAIRGMRNPLESWQKSDSYWTHIENPETLNTAKFEFFMGENDLDLAQRLIKGGSEHRKFLRYIHVQCDVTAGLFWWKEYDTYKVGTTANSTSTMHKLASKPITIDCFEVDDFQNIEYPIDEQRDELKSDIDNDFVQMGLIPYLEYLRKQYVETKDKSYWKELVRWLPESWLQTRTIDLNYEVLRNIINQRTGHKLTEWKTFIDWCHTLPYAEELLFYENKEQI